MKKHLLKIVLPAFAILLAVGLAFATETDSLLERGYIQGPSGPIEVRVDCKSEIQAPCLSSGQQVYQNQDYTDPMRKSNP